MLWFNNLRLPQLANNRVDLFHSPLRDEQMSPWLVVETADLYSRMVVRCVVDKQVVTDVHARVGDLGRA